MARHGPPRSPSPAGSYYASSKRPRRDDISLGKSRRDEGRLTQNASPSPDRVRDRQRRERSRDRLAYDDIHSSRHDGRDYYRGSGRDRRDGDRDYRRRSRDRLANSKSYRDDYYERDRNRDRFRDHDARRVRDRSPDPQMRQRNQSRTRRAVSPASDRKKTEREPTEEEKKAERLAKLQAWKEKQAAERDRKLKDHENADSPRDLLAEIDQRASADSLPVKPATTTNSSVEPPITANGDLQTASYAGKFDPKAIAKKATSTNSSKTILGTDLPIEQHLDGSHSRPSQSLASRQSDHVNKGTAANSALKARGNVSGFGLSSKGSLDPERAGVKPGIDFGDEDGGHRKLEKLPTLAPDETVSAEDDVMLDANDEEQVGDDNELQEAGTEEEAAAAARLAADKREERIQSRNAELAADESKKEDTVMSETTSTVQQTEKVEEDEADPLDAFMSDLTDTKTGLSTDKSATFVKPSKLGAPQAMFGDDDVDLDAIKADTDDILNITSKKKKKDLPKVNHEKVQYRPFRKSFYQEPLELSEMTEADVADLRLELDGIKIRGVDAPKPVQKWSQCGLGVQTLEVITKLGYERPSAIQSQAIPAIMSGRDVIGVAKTGSGKTIAFLLPMFRHIKDQRPLDTLDGPIGLVMTPTRELATQIHRECKPFIKALGLRAVCAYGGAPIKDQIADLKRGAELIVCTPGRMIDLLAANSGRVTNLRRVTYIVLDEADRMFDMGFEPQVMKILANIRPDKQTVLFSATFPRQMESLARKTLVRPVEIVVGGRSVVAPEITQLVEVRSEETKFLRLLELLGDLYSDEKNEDDRALIFMDRQESADALLRDLMRKGYPCMSIHGGKDQIDRDSTIDDFKAGVIPILIATSVAARGLDVKQLKLVVNFDAPNHLEDYVHRAGRTGRAGNTGTAVTFITPDQDRYSLDIAKALRQSGQPIPDDLQNLVNAFMEKVKSGKEKVSGSGFGGKGLERLDQERDAARTRERKSYKTGDDAEDDDKDEKADKDGKEDNLITKAASMVQSSATAAATAPVPATPSTSQQLSGVPKGIDLDGKIIVHKSETPAAGSSGGGRSAAANNPLDKVGQAVANIHNRLSKNRELRQGVPIDNKGPDAGAFHATLEINDFPQKARWAVTNRTNVAKILEATGTSITTKGSFYPAGKEPQAEEDPKLYILVEGDTEVVVTTAMRELMRLLKEGTIAAADSDARAPTTGRYNVV